MAEANWAKLPLFAIKKLYNIKLDNDQLEIYVIYFPPHRHHVNFCHLF